MVEKKALLNVLASGVYLPSACLEIIDCTGHLEAGGKKDAKYIANHFLPLIKQFELESENMVDLALFDGASNVQKAGDVLAAIDFFTTMADNNDDNKEQDTMVAGYPNDNNVMTNAYAQPSHGNSFR